LKNSKKEQLLSALLTHQTIKAAAKSVNLPESTAFRWLRDEEFSEEYRQRKRQMVAEASNFLQLKIGEAVRIIDGLMNSEKVSPRTRLDAARTILEFGYKAIEQGEIIERLELLEAEMTDTER